MVNVILYGADLRNASLENTNLYCADLRNADIDGTKLGRAFMDKTNLIGADLNSADLHDVRLCGAKLNGAKLINANLYKTNMYKADLRDADLSGAKLYGAYMIEVYLEGARYGDYLLKKGSRIFSVVGMPYEILYIDYIIRIGCITHSYDEWSNLTDKQILEIGGKEAIKWWHEWKPYILEMRPVNNKN